MTDRPTSEGPSTRRAMHCVTTLRPFARAWTGWQAATRRRRRRSRHRGDAAQRALGVCALGVRGQPPAYLRRRSNWTRRSRRCAGGLHQQNGGSGASFALASRVFDGAHWSALLPSAPLRYWRLVDLDSRRDGSLSHARLLVSERTLHHLLGLVYLDDSLHALLERGRTPTAISGRRTATRRGAHLEAALVGCRQRIRHDRRRRPVAAQRRGARVRGSRSAPVRAARRRCAGRRDRARPPGARLDAGSAACRRRSCSSKAALRRRSPRSPIESARRWSSAPTTTSPDGSRSFVRLHLTAPTSNERKASWRAALGERAEDARMAVSMRCPRSSS